MPDFRRAGEKGQDIARLLGQPPVDGRSHLFGDFAGLGLRRWCTRAVFHAHGVAPARAQNHRGVIQQSADRLGVQGGGHDQELEVVAQPGHHIEAEGQGQICLQAALVELVEDHQPHPGQLGIVLHPPGEHSFGNHLYLGCRRDLCLKTDPVAHGLPDLLPHLPGHETGGQPGGQAARFEHQDVFSRQPGFTQQGQGCHRGLARTWGSAEHHRLAAGELRPQRGDDFVDGEGAYWDTIRNCRCRAGDWGGSHLL